MGEGEIGSPPEAQHHSQTVLTQLKALGLMMNSISLNPDQLEFYLWEAANILGGPVPLAVLPNAFFDVPDEKYQAALEHRVAMRSMLDFALGCRTQGREGNSWPFY